MTNKKKQKKGTELIPIFLTQPFYRNRLRGLTFKFINRETLYFIVGSLTQYLLLNYYQKKNQEIIMKLINYYLRRITVD